ncbi:MAG TPA: hypothetical protein VFV15_03035 [Moraxellaceae bacterium]|nr:hypothetical protein [Moraxellaceae bacterium]
MAERTAPGAVREDVLAVTGHCCSARLTHLPALEDGIDFRPDAALRAAFARLQREAGAAPPQSPAESTPSPDAP